MSPFWQLEDFSAQDLHNNVTRIIATDNYTFFPDNTWLMWIFINSTKLMVGNVNSNIVNHIMRKQFILYIRLNMKVVSRDNLQIYTAFNYHRIIYLVHYNQKRNVSSGDDLQQGCAPVAALVWSMSRATTARWLYANNNRCRDGTSAIHALDLLW